jgi:hypothetical protein
MSASSGGAQLVRRREGRLLTVDGEVKAVLHAPNGWVVPATASRCAKVWLTVEQER